MLFFSFDPQGVCYIDAPYNIAGHTTAVYTCLVLLSVVFQVEMAIFVRASDWETILAWVFLICRPYCSLPLIQRSNTLSWAFGAIWCLPRSTIAVILNFFGLWVRCSNSYFLGANKAPCFWAYSKHSVYALFSVWQLDLMLLSYVIRCTSSTNHLICTQSPDLAQFSISGTLKKRKKICEIGNLWGIPVSIKKTLLVLFPIVIEVDLPPKKLFVHLTMYSGIPLVHKLYSSWGWDTWSNALLQPHSMIVRWLHFSYYNPKPYVLIL